jgi:hypothetical protein
MQFRAIEDSHRQLMYTAGQSSGRRCAAARRPARAGIIRPTRVFVPILENSGESRPNQGHQRGRGNNSTNGPGRLDYHAVAR